jgi:hypothetical protein
VHSFFIELQDARRREAEARVRVRSRIIVNWVGWVTLNYESSGLGKASSLLAHHDWSWSRRRRWLRSAGNETGNSEGEDSVFHRMYRGVCFTLIVAVIARENA